MPTWLPPKPTTYKMSTSWQAGSTVKVILNKGSLSGGDTQVAAPTSPHLSTLHTLGHMCMDNRHWCRVGLDRSAGYLTEVFWLASSIGWERIQTNLDLREQTVQIEVVRTYRHTYTWRHNIITHGTRYRNRSQAQVMQLYQHCSQRTKVFQGAGWHYQQKNLPFSFGMAWMFPAQGLEDIPRPVPLPVVMELTCDRGWRDTRSGVFLKWGVVVRQLEKGKKANNQQTVDRFIVDIHSPWILHAIPYYNYLLDQSNMKQWN